MILSEKPIIIIKISSLAIIIEISDEILQCIPNMVTNEQNLILECMETMEELRRVVL